MKIVINLRKVSRSPSGIGMYTYNLVNLLLGLEGIEIVGITDILESKEILELNKKIKIYKFGKEVNNNVDIFRYYFNLKKILKKEKPKVYWEPNNLIPWYLKIKGMKIVTTIHDFFPITDSEYISKKYIIYFRLFMLLTLKQSDKIICISQKTKKELNQLYPRIVKSKKIEVIYNYIDVSEKEIENQIEEKFYLYLGTLNKRKGIHILLDAFKIYLKKTKNPIKLILAGGIEDKSLLDKIKEIKAINNEKIEYKGYICIEEKKNLLSKCYAFIFPSLAEGFGIPPIEALSYNRPLILSSLEIFYEILGNENNYFKIEKDYDKTVCNLVDELSKNLIKNSKRKEIFDKVSKDKITREIEEGIKKWLDL